MFVCFLVVITALLRVSWAGVHQVGPDQSIQAAVNVAMPFDTILIQDGLHAETVITYAKPLIIASEYLLDGDATHIALTVVQPGSALPDTQSCFVYAYHEPVGTRLVGLTVECGLGTFWDRRNERAGGNIYISQSSVSVEHCRIVNGSAVYGGGVAIAGYSQWEYPDAVALESCLISDCDALTWGGGVYASYCSLRVTSCIFESDSADLEGGGLRAGSCVLIIDSCRFVHCYGLVGGVTIGGGHSAVVNSLFEYNGTPSWQACHLSASGSRTTISGSVFRNNTASITAVALDGHFQPIRFIGNLVEDNHDSSYSAIITVSSAATGEIAYNIIRNNVTNHGGVIYCMAESVPRIHHNLITNNLVLDEPNWGSAVFSITNARPMLDSNILTGHQSPVIGIDWQFPVALDARHNYWGHPSGPYHPTQNPQGQGDTLLSDSVLFIPWLTEPPDTSLPEGYLAVSPERTPLPSTWHLLDCYPNPFNQSVTLVIAGFASGDFEIELYNLLGQVVDVVHRGPLTGGQIHYQAPPWLSSGVYLLAAHDKQNVQTKKVVLLK